MANFPPERSAQHLLTQLRRIVGGHESDAHPAAVLVAPAHPTTTTPIRTGHQLTREGVLEEFLRGLLRPMIQQWLEDNLESVVRRAVQEQITRTTRVSEEAQDESFATIVAALALRRRGRS